jgi:tRNA dimethylallyltransferase
MPRLPKIIVILGPTSSGKTDLSLKLAKKFNGEIISADSRQIYKGMDIATGKAKSNKNPPQPFFNKGVGSRFSPFAKGGIKGGFLVSNIPHYMMDIANPDEEFSVAEYKKAAIEIAEDIIKRGKTPFLVGGTGLYIKAVVDNYDIPKILPNRKLRDDFEMELTRAKESRVKNPAFVSQNIGLQRDKQESRVLEKFYKRLLKLDPGAEELVDKNNPRRIIRALEVCIATGEPFSELYKKGEQIFCSLQIGINVPRDVLYKRIDDRVDKMIKEGLVEETKNLIKKGYSAKLPSMSGIGYKEIEEYLRFESRIKNQESREKILKEKIQEMKWRTHNYARRQMTWFKKDKRVRWVMDYEEAEKLIKKWLKNPKF